MESPASCATSEQVVTDLARPLGAGANVIEWDGRDDSGELVGDDLYVVVVEALGESERQTLAVVR